MYLHAKIPKMKNPDDVCTILLLRVTYIILIHKCS
jgi:hypothetical protein